MRQGGTRLPVDSTGLTLHLLRPTGGRAPGAHLHMLEVVDRHGFFFGTVQMPLNVMDAHFNSFGQRVLPVLTQKTIGILGMKPVGSGDILKSNTVTAMECLNFAMNLPVSVCITGCDSTDILNQGLGVARNFQPMTPAQVAALLARTEAAAANGQFEAYKFAKY